MILICKAWTFWARSWRSSALSEAFPPWLCQHSKIPSPMRPLSSAQLTAPLQLLFDGLCWVLAKDLMLISGVPFYITLSYLVSCPTNSRYFISPKFPYLPSHLSEMSSLRSGKCLLAEAWVMSVFLFRVTVLCWLCLLPGNSCSCLLHLSSPVAVFGWPRTFFGNINLVVPLQDGKEQWDTAGRHVKIRAHGRVVAMDKKGTSGESLGRGKLDRRKWFFSFQPILCSFTTICPS